MRKSFLATLAVAVVLISTLASAQDEYNKRTGLFLGAGLGIAEANFDLETGNDDADVGGLFDLRAGWAFHDRWAATVGVAPAAFVYKYSAGFGPFSKEGERALTFMMIDISGWYFQPIYKDIWKLFVRLGLGSTTVADEIDGQETDSKSSAGVLLAAGLEGFFGQNWAFFAEVYGRSYGVTFQGMDDKEIWLAGLVLGVNYR